MTLAYPWLLLLFTVPLLLRRYLRPVSIKGALPKLPVLHWYRGLPGTNYNGVQSTGFRNHLWWLFWALLVLAAARPQTVAEETSLPETGRDLMLVVDISPSMLAQDMVIDRQAISRLDAVKQVGRQFIEQREGDRLGLIVFSTTAHLYSPLTFDHETVATFLDESFVGMAGRATAIGDAMGLAVRYLKEHAGDDAVIVFLTDGEHNAGELTPEMGAELAASYGFRTYAVGVGRTDTGRGGFMGLRQGGAGGADIDTLRAIALPTGGEYYMARDAATLGLIYEEINQLEAIEHEGKTYYLTADHFHWPLGFAAFVLIALILPKREGGR